MSSTGERSLIKLTWSINDLIQSPFSPKKEYINKILLLRSNITTPHFFFFDTDYVPR
jgi:hypothetical protein